MHLDGATDRGGTRASGSHRTTGTTTRLCGGRIGIQDAMGWKNCHLHEFLVVDSCTALGTRIGIPDDDFSEEHPTLPEWEEPIAPAEPEHPEHEAMLTWAGGACDPHAFDPTHVRFDDPRARWKPSDRGFPNFPDVAYPAVVAHPVTGQKVLEA